MCEAGWSGIHDAVTAVVCPECLDWFCYLQFGGGGGLDPATFLDSHGLFVILCLGPKAVFFVSCYLIISVGYVKCIFVYFVISASMLSYPFVSV
jgi:hypothetical protein